MDLNKLQDYHCDFDPARYEDEVLVLDGRTTQGRDLNNSQRQAKHHISGIGDAMFANGHVVEGADIVVNPDTGATKGLTGKIYLRGAVRAVPASEFFIPVTGSVSVGVYLRESVRTELEDPTLYNPAVGWPGEGDPGSVRLIVEPAWGYAGDGGEGEFYPVHVVEDGVVRAKTPPTSFDELNKALSRYDVISTNGGTYVGEGYVVRYAGLNAAGAQMYTVSEGRAQVYGNPVSMATSRRLTYATAPDLREVPREIYTAKGSGRQRIDLARTPVHSVHDVTVTRQKTAQMKHGSYTGCSDMLPDTGVVDLLEVKQGDTVYVAGADYTRTGDAVNWSPMGNEPQTLSTYYVTYTYLCTAEVEELDFDGFYVSDALVGTSIIVSYRQALMRRDRLCLTLEGRFIWHKGVSSEFDPPAPIVGRGTLGLATILQTWRNEPVLKNDAPQSLSFEEISSIKELAYYLLNEIARNRLETDVSTREAGARVGVFVDPLLDDMNRDQGFAQTGAVFGGQLTLPIKAAFHVLPLPALKPAIPPYEMVPYIEQTLRTGDMLINEYMNFDVLPARITLNPATDFWTDVETSWASSMTQEFGSGSLSSSSTVTETISSSTSNLEFLRERDIIFTSTGFGNGELLDKVIFDGIEVTTDPLNIKADESGRIEGRFAIPPRIPAGAKTVAIHGRGGSYGTTSFVGQGKLTVQTLRSVTTVTRFEQAVNLDPLCQTMTLDADRMVCGIDVWFKTRNTEVRIQAREVENGQPASTILAEGSIQPEDIVITGNGHTRIPYDLPCFRQKDEEFGAVLMCNDPTTSVWVAEGSKFDAFQQKWVSAQPYTVGVLLSSSNASTWTPHQNIDLAFRLLVCKFTPGPFEVDMGSVTVENATDLILWAVDECPTADTRVEYTLTLPDSSTLTVANSQPVRLEAPATGSVSVKATLYASEHAAPLVWPNAVLVAGTVAEEGDYLSRWVPATGANRAVLVYEAFVPAGASVIAEIMIDDGEWGSVPVTGTVQQGDGIVEFTHMREIANAGMIKARFTLVGGIVARPSVYNIRLMAVK